MCVCERERERTGNTLLDVRGKTAVILLKTVQNLIISTTRRLEVVQPCLTLFRPNLCRSLVAACAPELLKSVECHSLPVASEDMISTVVKMRKCNVIIRHIFFKCCTQEQHKSLACIVSRRGVKDTSDVG